MKTSLLILSGEDVEHLVQTALDPREVVQCMARTFELVSGSEIGEGVNSEHDRVQLPPRLTTLSPAHATLYMPCRLPTSVIESSNDNKNAPTLTAIKVVSVPRTGGQGGIPGTTLVLDEETGGVRAVVNSRALTALRNAAGSVLATQLLATPTPTHIALFGAGLQIKQHARLFLQTYPSITHCTVINRSSNDRFNNLIEHLRLDFPKTQIQGLISTSTPDPQIESAVREADVICTATSSTQPLFDSTWLKPGAHVNLVGSYTPAMRETDTGLIKRAGRRIVVDEAKSCLVEAGELVDAELLEKELVEIGVLVRGGLEGEMNKNRIKEVGDVTVFKSVGVGAQDVAVAALMVELAEREERIGVRVPYD
ncbi:hypothetical protein FRC07_003492 [Ceratobasidium sp. 392]|nr:hypothetical protein FRC07_003492 [Ceratobasidium sp. 392]